MTIETAEQAEEQVRKHILPDNEHDFVIQEQLTQKRAFGWVVFYTTRKYLETNDPSFLVPGTGPIAVLKDGEIVTMTTSMPPPAAIEAFEAEWKQRVVHK